ncbi:hypothetical protein AMJ83_09525 [candidate division WOR_3 bacterium SM23_42]|uniref:N-acetyltransferase domain-containing protein n=1 Tax=candidate division WOR_3 bacterium SM23_42 TaxID=1703779 RepID=A0A0S8FQ36_UNCW3|nr:MAG: hypothetical protein AMJ83_09525 [candidate division WOR_3 bacterium SM23_42]
MRRRRFDGFAKAYKREVLNMYAFDLRNKMGVIAPGMAVNVSAHEKPVEARILHKSTAEERVARGEKIFVAYYQKNPIAYLFASTGDCWIGEIEDWLVIDPDEIYLYDAFTSPEYRGRGIYPLLINRAAGYFRNRSYRYTMIFATGSNTESIRGIEKCGFKCYEIVHYRNFLGWKSWHFIVGERHVGSRLSNEN